MIEVEFQLPHITLRALSNNQTQKPLLLALHGWLDNAATFLPMAPYLTNYHFISIDLAGHGLSDHRSQDTIYHFPDWIYDLAQLIQQQQWQQVILLGHSMGGMISSAFTAIYPELVHKLVLVESIGLVALPEEKTAEQLKSYISSRQQLSQKRKPIHPTQESAITARQAAGDLSYQAAKVLVERGLHPYEQGFTWRADPKIRTYSAIRYSEQQVIALLKNIKTPTLMLKAEQSLPLIIDNLAKYQQYYSDLSVIEVPGGHHPHLDHPKAISFHIQDFLNTEHE